MRFTPSLVLVLLALVAFANIAKAATGTMEEMLKLMEENTVHDSENEVKLNDDEEDILNEEEQEDLVEQSKGVKGGFVSGIESKAEWQEMVDFEGVSIVEFYTDSCPHCQAFAPMYKKFAKTFSFDKSLTMAKVNARTNDETEDMTEEQGIEGFPTVFCFPTGGKRKKYTGDRSWDSLIFFYGDCKGMPIEMPDQTYMEEYSTNEAKLMLTTGVFKKQDEGVSALHAKFNNAFKSVGKHMPFLHAYGDEEKIFVYGQHNNDEFITNDSKIDDLEAWIWSKTVMPVTKYSDEVLNHPYFKDYLLFFSVDSLDEAIVAINDAFMAAGTDKEACAAQFIFADMRTTKDPFKVMENFGLSPDTPLPALLGITVAEEAYPKKYLYPSKIDITETNIKTFCNVYLEGKAPRVFKTEAPKETPESYPLKLTTSSEFDKNIVESMVPSIVVFTQNDEIDRRMRLLSKVLEFVSTSFEGSDVGLFSVDIAKNEHEYFPFELDIKKYPLIMVYGPGNLEGVLYEYDQNDLCTEELREFVEDTVKQSQAPPPSAYTSESEAKDSDEL